MHFKTAPNKFLNLDNKEVKEVYTGRLHDEHEPDLAECTGD